VLEMEVDNIKSLPDSIGSYFQYINSNLGIKSPSIDLEYLEKAFHLLPVFVMTSKKKKEYERTILAYACLVIDYMVKEKGAAWVKELRYHVYNSYLYPMMQLGGEVFDVIAEVYVAFNNTGKLNFNHFLKTITE
jgi:hypothetical protein